MWRFLSILISWNNKVIQIMGQCPCNLCKGKYFSMWSRDNFLINLSLCFLKKRRKISLHYKKTCWLSWDCEIICLVITLKKLRPRSLFAVVVVFTFLFYILSINALFCLEFLSHNTFPLVDRLRSCGSLKH